MTDAERSLAYKLQLHFEGYNATDLLDRCQKKYNFEKQRINALKDPKAVETFDMFVQNGFLVEEDLRDTSIVQIDEDNLVADPLDSDRELDLKIKAARQKVEAIEKRLEQQRKREQKAAEKIEIENARHALEVEQDSADNLKNEAFDEVQ